MTQAPTYDFVIIGAGTAGCLLANRLSADPACRVLLVEAGGEDNYHWIHIPVGYLRCIGNPRTDWRYRTERETGLNGRDLLYPRGKVLGGSSSINGMIYMRGQARDYDGWAAATGDDAWSWRNVLPDFRAHECSHRCAAGADTEYHGAGGEWRVSRQRLRWDILDAFADAAGEAGIPRIEDFNCGDNTGVSYFDVNQRNGWRVSAAKAFLKPARSRSNLTVWSRTTAERLQLEFVDGRPRCIGATLLRDGERVTVRAAREVILSAGAIASPQLLQLSGIGPAPLLREHGIEVRHELPGVGANLQDHLQIRPVFKVRGVRTLNVLAASFWGRLGIALEYALRRTGPMSMAPSQLGAFAKSDPARPHPNLQYHVQPLSLRAYDQPPDTFAAFTASVCNLNPTSRGSVRIRSADIHAPPRIAPNYLATGEDRRVAVDSLRLTRRIVAQPALAAYQPEEYLPGPQFTTDADLLREGGNIANTIFHPVGTARMGRAGDPDAVVDSHLRVRGVGALRVVDASIMPAITSGNTNSPTLMIAEKAARWIAQGT
ncbi:MAG TPA: GMC family oxidoreductase N-terminal domain-containing protein [Steroidobacteraceae bacterium]|jgi:choline dehydrogenase|nr:GMC family oxidoreductase N-terminal domain-containing protein [Steroidobacteraceae bacterium]